MYNHFKTQQEVMKYVADGGVVINRHGKKVEFDKSGKLNFDYHFDNPDYWQPYIEPKPKTKVWRWEKVCSNNFGTYLEQTLHLWSEKYANEFLSNYTKVPNSEREI